MQALSTDILRKKIRAGAPLWMREQIEKDLKPFKEKGITQTDIEHTLSLFNHETLPLTVRCKVIKRRIYFSYPDTHKTIIAHKRFNSLMYALRLLMKNHTLPDLDFVISLHDTIGTDTFPPLGAPVFTFARNKHHHSLVPFPDPEALEGYALILQTVAHASHLHPFDQKISKAFWRGTTTGGTYSMDNWQEFPRSKLVLFSKDHPELLDAKFAHVLQTAPGENLSSLLYYLGLTGPHVSIADHLAFKYLVDMDGNSCTYSRLVWILHSNSLCLKQISDNEQWYYSLLKPYVHYLPFQSDMSDFASKLQWAEENPDKVQEMIHNANILAKESLTQEDTFQYLYELLKAYAKLQKF